MNKNEYLLLDSPFARRYVVGKQRTISATLNREDQMAQELELLREREAAKLLNVTQKCLQAYRARGKGPRYVKFGRNIRYAKSDLMDFIRVVDPKKAG